MKHLASFLWLLGAASLAAAPALPENLVLDGVPAVSEELRARAARYFDFRTASFQGWSPQKREMLISTRFADVPQLHAVEFPGAARRQLTFSREPISSALWQPGSGKYIVYAQDAGGGEFFQLYRFDTEDGSISLLTDGKSRNTDACWSRDGQSLAFCSTKRNGRDTDIYVMDPKDPASARMVLQVSGGGWAPNDWSPDGERLAIEERISINESYVWLIDLKTGEKTLLTAKTGEKSSFVNPRFGKDGATVYAISDFGSEFRRLVRLRLMTDRSGLVEKDFRPIASFPADVEFFDISRDGERIAFVTNEDGMSVLRIMNARNGKILASPRLGKGVISGLEWNESGTELGFTFASARSAGDAWSFQLKSGRVERWTASETSGLDASKFVEPELVRLKSFDGLPISAFVYAPDPAKHPGPRPVLVLIHGGPESQSRPGFIGRLNYFINEMGLALVVPNVRGSSGFGKTFLTLDNGFKREDTLKDIGAVLDWVGAQPPFDRDRVAVIGGSYGGFMVLASMIHHADRLKAGVDIVGISNFLTFLKNTQDYRRDLRRVEYGDERDEKMREFLQKISPSTQAEKIRDPLFVIQGKNDPRVPMSESEQMVRAVRGNGGTVWYLMAKDEGHGFQKKQNQDFQYLATILFLQEFLVN